MNIKNIKVNNLILDIEWLFVLFFHKIKDKKVFTSDNEIINNNIRSYEDEFKFLTTEEIYYFLEEERDFWKQITINEKIEEISQINEEQYQLLNRKKY